MRWVVLVLTVLARTSHADDVTDLVAKGEILAKQGEFTSAIDAFKQADAKQPRAEHACLIGLVYTRRELWPQAELFLARCRARATESDPPPVWLPKVEQQLADKLIADGVAPVTIVVTPATAKPRLTVSSFAPDETFEPRTIHLAPGHHVVGVTADGFIATSREIVVDTSAAQTITIDLHTAAEAEAARAAAVPHPPVQPAKPAAKPVELPLSPVPAYFVVGGVGLGLVGAALDVFLVRPARDDLAAAPDTAIYKSREASFDLRRDLAIGAYAGAAIAVITGIALRYTVYDRLQIAPTIDRNGGGVAVTWSR